jgi:hypothetical protein
VYLKNMTNLCAGHGEERESNCEAYWRCAYCGLVWFMYKGTLVTSLSETVVSMQQFLSSSCNPCIIICYYLLVVLQSYFLLLCLYVCSILEAKKKCKQFSLHEKTTFLEELGNCNITGRYLISPVILSTYWKDRRSRRT